MPPSTGPNNNEPLRSLLESEQKPAGQDIPTSDFDKAEVDPKTADGQNADAVSIGIETRPQNDQASPSPEASENLLSIYRKNFSRNARHAKNRRPASGTRNRHSLQTGIVYPDVARLSRPIDLPFSIRCLLVLFLLAAACIGAYAFYSYYDRVYKAPAEERQALLENVSREVSYGFPDLLTMVDWSDQEMLDALNSTDYTLYEKTPLGSSDSISFEVIKLPENVSLAEGAAIYAQGINNISASTAALVLNGSWDLDVTHSGASTLVRIRYADFASQSAQEAIQRALAEEGLADKEIADQGIDEAENIYAAGSFSIEDKTYSWRVSVVPLSDIYTNKDLPDTAFYVGIRLSN